MKFFLVVTFCIYGLYAITEGRNRNRELESRLDSFDDLPLLSVDDKPRAQPAKSVVMRQKSTEQQMTAAQKARVIEDMVRVSAEVPVESFIQQASNGERGNPCPDQASYVHHYYHKR